jgi:phosphatidylglycerophosphate synthase
MRPLWSLVLLKANGSQVAGEGPPRLLVIGRCDVTLWGLSPAERHARAFRRAGVSTVLGEGQALPRQGQLVMIRAEYVIAEELVRALVESPDVVLVVEGGKTGEQIAVAAHVDAAQAEETAAFLGRGGFGPEDTVPADLRVLGPVELGSQANIALRKRAVPFVLSLAERPLAEVEKQTFAAVYKGATDFVTKWCWPVPARWVTRWAAPRGISPNSVTTLSLVFVFLATYLFAEGHFLTGVIAAWFMTFLDTVDGKLARVTFTSSKWGNVYDHGIDLIHPPFWWVAWWYALQDIADPALLPSLELALWIVIVGYVAGRVLEGIFLHAFKIQTHIWRPLDSFFRTITARRNPNLAILMVGALLGRPDLGFLAIALWTVLCLVFHALRILQAALVRLRGGRITSWLNEPG